MRTNEPCVITLTDKLDAAFDLCRRINASRAFTVALLAKVERGHVEHHDAEAIIIGDELMGELLDIAGYVAIAAVRGECSAALRTLATDARRDWEHLWWGRSGYWPENSHPAARVETVDKEE